jgi:hypothetical protein
MRQSGRWHRKRGRTPIKADQKSRLPAFLRSEKRMFTSAGSSVWLLGPQDVHEMAISLCSAGMQNRLQEEAQMHISISFTQYAIGV